MFGKSAEKPEKLERSRHMRPELFKEKSEFIATLELALLRDERSGGGVKRILATGNSNGANDKSIIRAVYGK